MKKLLAIPFIFLLFILASEANAAPPIGFQTTQIIGTGLDSVTGFDMAPDGRIFILERSGTVLIFKNGQLLPTPFIQLNSVTTGDRGLTGIAFDPDFNNNHYVYFYFTGADNYNRLVRVDGTGDTASGSPVTLYKTSSPSFELHIGGTIRFGGDGKLYISIGDNGNGGNAQDLSTPFGKIIRINKDGSIPSDNPFVGQSGKLPEIWAYGFRNPFRFQFDSATDRLYVGDVGNDTWEEINLVAKGGNYGWPTCEGTCSNSGFINPTYTYAHNGQSSSVTGGLIYHGSMFPASYAGRYFFGDYARGFIKTLTLDGSGNSTGVSDFDLNAGSVVDLKAATDGSIYYVTFLPARLYRITYSTSNQTPTAKSSSDTTSGEPPLTVNFSSSGSFDPEGTQLTYKWDFGDGTSSTEANPQKTYGSKGRFVVELTVSDGQNSAQAEPIIIQVGTPPVITISSPTDNSTYKAGDTIQFSGSGTDSSGQALPESAFTTDIVFHHDTHIHPFLGPIQISSGQFTIPTTGEPDPDTYFEIQITGTDSDGLQTTESVNVIPLKVDLTFATDPPGLQILLDDIPTNTPTTLTHVIGFERNISVPVVQDIGSQPYIFSSWSDGGVANHTITAPEVPTAYTANFTPLPTFKGEYFNNKTLTGTPALTRQDSEINFIWGESSPGTGVNPDNFSVRWTNTVFFSAGKYRFTTTSDDGVRLYIDNQLIIDKWIDQSATSYYKDVDLTSGNHTIKMEYYDGVYDAQAQLSWELLFSPTTPTITPTPIPTSIPTPTPTSSTPSPTPSPSPTPTPTPISTDFKGEYWNTPSAGSEPSFPSTSADLTRYDPQINFNWGTNSPDPIIDVDHFMVRWTKQVDFNEGTYMFTVTADDGIRLYLDNQLIIDKWIDQSATTYNVQGYVSQGTHQIKVEYYENGWDAIAQFSFIQLDGATPTPTPSPSPSPTPTPTTTPVGSPTPTPSPTPVSQVNGLRGEYFDNSNLTNSKLVRTDSSVNFDWGSGSPDSVIGRNTFSVRWTGQIIPQYSETYTLYTTTDDGVRLWVNNQLLIDKWKNQSAKEWSGQITLTAGQKYDIKMEYFENKGDAIAKLYWSSPNQLKQIIPQSRLFSN